MSVDVKLKKSKARKVRQKQKAAAVQEKLKLALDCSNKAIVKSEKLVKVLEK